jgi:hypothetical protein
MKYKLLLSSLLAIGIAVSPFAANATTVTSNFNKGTITNSAVLIGSVFTVPGDSFIDNWNFTIAPTEQFAAIAADIDNLSAFEISPSSFGAKLIGSSQTWNAVKVGDTIRFDSMVLAPGNYDLQIFGTIVGTIGGAYAGTISAFAVPVPEPETYAMMLVGLGMMGFMVRRRKEEQI